MGETTTSELSKHMRRVSGALLKEPSYFESDNKPFRPQKKCKYKYWKNKHGTLLNPLSIKPSINVFFRRFRDRAVCMLNLSIFGHSLSSQLFIKPVSVVANVG